MNLFEFFSNNAVNAYKDTSNDGSKLEYEDTRKTRLTLKQIHQLRRMSDVKDIEKKNEIDRLKKIYGSTEDSGI